ncbi:HAD phosphatase, family IIIB domain protein [Streptococcus oralis SK313]|uniref:HAD phosphatase, family IIIB domain protein n=1 Tax=Streptococcus oralis SK313 TaxID=1035190 RepID=F9Q3B9_STROR|nr:HAD phosphatase, family IIIB domain protein [Streptococcus oralis SK313]
MKISKVTITIASTLASVILLTGCGTNSANSQTTQSSTSDNQVTMTYDQLRSRENTMSTLWYQKAAETKALYLQGYNVATDRLKELLKTQTDKPYSIVLDLDETVLDNSPYQAQNVKDGTAFTPENWDVWVKKPQPRLYQVPKTFSNLQTKTVSKFTMYLTAR